MADEEVKSQIQSDDDGDGGEDRGDGGFMQMFVTLSLILLAFFILLNSMSVPNDKKMRMALGSLLGSFGIMPGGDDIESESQMDMDQDSILMNQGMFEVFSAAKKALEEMLAKSTGSAEDAEITFDKTTGEIKVILSERLLFSTGAAAISPRIFPLLDKIARIAKASGGSVRVLGHTDDRPSRKMDNWELSLERGVIIARHLEAAGGLRRGVVSASGAAHYQPRNENKTPEGRAANRRVEIFIKTRKKSP